MAPARHKAFSVRVLLDQSGQSDCDTVAVSKDIYNELAVDPAGHRYSALSAGLSRTWSLYLARLPSVPSDAHSTIWVPASNYDKFCNHQVVVRSASPIALSAVILAFPATTYHLVSSDSADLQTMAARGRVFRTGDVIEINGYRGQMTFCEPVRQGVITNATEIVLARESKDMFRSEVYVDSDEDSDDDTVGDLGFSALLASGTLGMQPKKTEPLNYSIPLLSELSDTPPPIPVQALSHYIDNTQIHPRPSDLEDDDFRAFAPMTVLIELGCFSGDNIELSTQPWHEAAPSRSMRLYSLPSDCQIDRADSIYLPPILFHNIFSESISSPRNLYLRKVKAGRRTQIPTAKAVVLGRIPSPASTDRTLQPAFLVSLKVHFETCRRVVRRGDVLLLGIDETLARVMAAEGLDSEILADYTQSSVNRPDTFAWFKILDVEVDVDQGDHYCGDVMIDASNTRMVQSGIEKSRIPPLNQWAEYYQLPPVPSLPSDQGSPYAKMFELISSTFSKAARRTRACATILLHGARGSGKKMMVSTICASLGMHFLEVNCYDIVGETELKTEAYLRLRFEKASQCAPCLLLLRNIDALAKKKDDQESGQESAMRFILADCLKTVAQEAGDQFPVAIVATTADKSHLPEGVSGCFRHDVEIGAPSEEERRAILQTLLKDLPLAPDVSIQSLAVRSAALVAIDLVNVVKRAQNFSKDRMEDLAEHLGGGQTISDLHVAGVWVTAGDFDQAISEARRNYSDSIGAPKIPNVTWDDVGGLASVKGDIMDTIQLPLERPELFASGMKKRSGILFYGPPGTGKTLLAKAVATSFSLNFFSVKGPELLNMYIGESEANVRRVFQRARDAKPCVVFFDELDSVAPKRGNQGDSGGVMDRIVSQLLSELDGMSEGKDGGGGVFVIGATNRPDLLDPALLRPGRFDKMLYLGVSDTDDAQLNILQALTRKFKLSPALDLRHIARACPFTYTGADFYALCSDAMLKAMTRQAGAADAKVKALDPPRSTQYFFDHIATKEDVEVVVSEEDFRAALRELIPSVSQSELDHYKKVQAQFSPPKKEEQKVDKGKGRSLETNGHSRNGMNGHFQADTNDDDEMYG